MDDRRGQGMTWYSALAQGVTMALDALVSNKVRSGLTVLGVAIGVAVVMIMAAVIQGVNDSFLELLSAQGPKTFYVQHATVTGGGGVRTGLEEEESEFLRNPPLDAAWADRLAELPGIRQVSPLADLTQAGFRARREGSQADVALLAVTSDYLEISSGDVVDGRFFTRSEERRGRRVAVVDPDVVSDLFGGRDPLGGAIHLGRSSDRGGGAAFEVVGIYEPPPNLFSGLSTHYVLVPFEAAWSHLDVWDRLMALVVRPEEATELAEALDVVRSSMRQIRGLEPGEEDDFALVTQDEILDLWDQLTTVLFSVMVALSGVGLMVGGIGVVGIMMISVTERTREIGLRKAMGARRRDVLWQFLVEASTLTLIGGGAGMLVGGGAVAALEAWT
ncbi:MAG: ABC transporter permease, partial [Gemmatimonadota bacterium]